MARFPRLRKTLQALVFASLPASASIGASGCCAGYEQPSYHDEVVVDTSEDTTYRDMIKACRMNDSACLALCDDLIVASGMAMEGEADFSECRLVEDQGTVMHLTYTLPDEGCIGGRRPAGLEPCRHPGAPSAVGAWLARTAHLEAASVPAFVFTARELERFGAPPQLVRRALVAAVDEIRHTRMIAALARRYRAMPARPQVTPPPPRSLVDFCVENEIEGNVRETYGAVVATWQAHMARDPAIRQAMTDIARDETEHAQLSADIRTWALSRLDPAQCTSLRRARAQAIAELVHSATNDVPHALVDLAGLPDATHALMLLERLRHSVW